MFFEEQTTLGAHDSSGDGGWVNDTRVPNIGVFDGGTVYGGGNRGSGIDWQSIINQGFGAASQIFSAWGRNPTQQSGAGGLPIGQGYSPAAILSAQAQAQAAYAAQQQQQQRQLGGGANSLDGIFGSLTSTISQNPLIFAAGAVGLFLLFRQPPGRK